MPIRAYDPTDDMLKVKSMQQKFRDSFGGSAIDTTKWDLNLHASQSLSVSGGNLIFGSGATANAAGSIIGEAYFTVPFRLSFGLTMSQRIANQTLYVEAISINPTTLLPDGQHAAGFMFDGATSTQAKYYVQNSGAAPLVSAAVTIPTSSGNGLYEIELFCDEAWFHGKTIDSSAARANSYCRHQQIPEPNALYKVQIRWVNGASAPASNSNATIPFVACQDYAELTAEITAGRGQSAAGQGIGVSVLSMPSITLTTPTLHILNSAATTNATSVKNTGGTISGVTVSNTGASTRYLKYYNKTSAPTVGTDIPVITIPVPAGTVQCLNIGGPYGLRMGTGIALAITGAAADTDATVIAAGEVKVLTSYV